MDFKQFADKVNRKFLELSASGTLLKVNASKEQLWDLPLDNGELNLYQIVSELVIDVQDKLEKALSFFKKITLKTNQQN